MLEEVAHGASTGCPRAGSRGAGGALRGGDEVAVGLRQAAVADGDDGAGVGRLGEHVAGVDLADAEDAGGDVGRILDLAVRHRAGVLVDGDLHGLVAREAHDARALGHAQRVALETTEPHERAVEAVGERADLLPLLVVGLREELRALDEGLDVDLDEGDAPPHAVGAVREHLLQLTVLALQELGDDEADAIVGRGTHPGAAVADDRDQVATERGLVVVDVAGEEDAGAGDALGAVLDLGQPPLELGQHLRLIDEHVEERGAGDVAVVAPVVKVAHEREIALAVDARHGGLVEGLVGLSSAGRGEDGDHGVPLELALLVADLDMAGDDFALIDVVEEVRDGAQSRAVDRELHHHIVVLALARPVVQTLHWNTPASNGNHLPSKTFRRQP